MAEAVEQRILICAPFGKDAELACEVLEAAGMPCNVCRTPTELVTELHSGASAVIIVEEVLQREASRELGDFIAAQPTWSDLPILVLMPAGGSPLTPKTAHDRLGNLMLLDRPLRASSLISAARTALRARQRQYEVRISNQRKDEFLAMLAHELRNPLAPISSAAELIRADQPDAEYLKRTSQVIIRQVRHMTGLIDDLLDVSRVTRGLVKVEKHCQDLKTIVPNAIEQVKPLIEARGHQLVIDMPAAPAYVMGDAKRLVQILTNLLNNAAKYTAEGGCLQVRMDVDADQVHLAITDNGAGIPPELQSNVFDLFSQGERPSDRSQGGLGIGLALVRNLVELHDGTVSCFSEGLGKGSRFTVTLPRLREQEVRIGCESDDHAIRPSMRPLRLMVVDDNVDSAEMLAMVLESSGHDVMVEHAPLRAIERARQETPDVCLLDIGLPDMDGNELARRLRAQPETADTVLIAITGYGQDQDRRKSLASGFQHHMVKPVDLDKLTTLLSQIKNPVPQM